LGLQFFRREPFIAEANPKPLTIATADLTVSTEQPDPSICPLCGADNRCAVTRGKTIESCWCASADISRDVIDAIPAALRNKACICPRCAGNSTTDSTAASNDNVSIWSKQ